MPRSVSMSRPGLTLVEVLAVVVILGLLAGTLAVGFSGAFGKGKSELAKTGLSIVAQKLETYHISTGSWPDDASLLDALTEGSAKPTDAYFLSPDKLLDPWGHPYELLIPGPDGYPYEIISLGADGQRGGTGENADITSVDLRRETDG
ncbi:MAG: type II secretion system protein GspG [Planctomycetota bacterium]